jgi:hypothetical protein
MLWRDAGALPAEPLTAFAWPESSPGSTLLRVGGRGQSSDSRYLTSNDSKLRCGKIHRPRSMLHEHTLRLDRMRSGLMLSNLALRWDSAGHHLEQRSAGPHVSTISPGSQTLPEIPMARRPGMAGGRSCQPASKEGGALMNLSAIRRHHGLSIQEFARVLRLNPDTLSLIETAELLEPVFRKLLSRAGLLPCLGETSGIENGPLQRTELKETI